jgi:hypothetical protein
MPAKLDEYLTVRQAAENLGVAPDILRAWPRVFVTEPIQSDA